MERVVPAPPSKSYTHRALICAALADGASTLIRPLDADDTRATAGGLVALGADITFGDGEWTVSGTGGKITPREESIDCSESGTTMRLLTGVAALSPEPIVLTGAPRLCERPIGELLNVLSQLGANARSLNACDSNCPPVEVYGGLRGGEVTVRGEISSQIISALLLAAPLGKSEARIRVEGSVVSAPYVALTADVMAAYGVRVTVSGGESCRVNDISVWMNEGFPGERVFHVRVDGGYKGYRCDIESDYSQAAYFALAGSLTNHEVTVGKLNDRSMQGDHQFLDVLARMGSLLKWKGTELHVRRGSLVGLGKIGMCNCPDIVPPLAVAAAFAKGETVITDVAHLEAKESPRITVLVNALKAMGIDAERIVECGQVTGLNIVGGEPKPTLIRTHRDHRIAMSFGCAKLVVPELELDDYSCVRKSYPGFWRDLNTATCEKHAWLRELSAKFTGS